MSLLVVINGPVASAGSIPYLSGNKGIKVPINEAIMITESKDTVIVIPVAIFTPSNKWLPTSKIVPKISPFNKLKLTSFINLFQSEPVMVLFAKP